MKFNPAITLYLAASSHAFQTAPTAARHRVSSPAFNVKMSETNSSEDKEKAKKLDSTDGSSYLDNLASLEAALAEVKEVVGEEAIPAGGPSTSSSKSSIFESGDFAASSFDKQPSAPKMDESTSSTMPSYVALVPVNEASIEFTSGLLGGALGFAVGGPVLAAIVAAATNYVSRNNKGEVTEIVQTVSKSTIQVYNYFAKLDAKYEMLEGARKSLQNALDDLEKSKTVDPKVVEQTEKALENTKKRLEDLNREYDFVNAGSVAFGVVGDLVEKAVNTIGDFNSEYQLTERARISIQDGVAKSKQTKSD